MNTRAGLPEGELGYQLLDQMVHQSSQHFQGKTFNGI